MDDDENSKPNKFTQDVEGSMRPERPDFTSDAEHETNKTPGERTPTGDYRGSENTGAKRYVAPGLNQAEQGATQNGSEAANEQQQEGGLYKAKDKEANPAAGGLYNPGAKGTSAKGDGKKKKKGKGKLAATGGILGLFIVFLVSMFATTGSVSTELISWKENLYSLFGQSASVINVRSNSMFRTLLSRRATTVSDDSIFNSQKFKISKKLVKKLQAQNIDYVETGSGSNKVKALIYHADDGAEIPVVADQADVGKLKAGAEVDVGTGKRVTLSSDAVTLDVARQDISDFDVHYGSATSSFMGKIAGWFDDLGNRMITRILGTNGRNQMNLGDDADAAAAENKLYENGAIDGGTDAQLDERVDPNPKKGRFEPAQAVDQDGNTIQVYDENGLMKGDERGILNESSVPDENFMSSKIMAESDSLAGGDVSAVQTQLTNKAMKAAAMGSNIAAAGCTFMNAIGSIGATVGAIQTINSVNYASKYLELADKIKAGDATTTTNTALEALDKKVKNTLYDMEGKKYESEVGHSILESDGFNTVFSEKNLIKENAPETVTVNREYALTAALRQADPNQDGKLGIGATIVSEINDSKELGGTINAVKRCNGIQVGGAIVNMALLFLTPGGVGAAVKEFLGQIWTTAAMVVVQTAIGLIVPMITGTIANWLGNKLVSVFTGEVGGTVLWAGAQSLMNSNLQMSTGRLVDEAGAKNVYALTKENEKTWARYERRTKSPFDVTSPYTFFGSLANSLRPVINLNQGDVTSTVTSLANLASDSAVALVSPSVHAAEEVAQREMSFATGDNCPRLQSVGVAGTATCHKYNGVYSGQLDTDPGYVYQKLRDYTVEGYEPTFEGEFSDGNPIINKDSEYAKYIVSCVVNDVQPGDLSAGIQSTFSQNHPTLSSLLGVIPVVGDILQLYESEQVSEGVKWSSGQVCTGKTDDPALNERVKYYSMYNLDQRALEAMDIVSTNSTTAFLDEYYKENPLDNSYEGIIARHSGQTKEEVTTNLAMIQYVIALSNYDPSERYAFGAERVKVKQPLRLDHDSTVQVAQKKAVVASLASTVEFADLRNRAMLV